MGSTTCDCQNCKYRELVLTNMKDEEINSLCDFKKEKFYKKGEIIVKEGDPVVDFFYLKSGLVKNYFYNQIGKEQIISIGTPMNFVSLLTVFSEPYHKYRVSALTDSVICCIRMDKIKSIALNNGQFAVALIEKMSKNTDEIILQKLMLSMKNMRGRIAYVLLFFAEKINYSYSYEIPLRRKEIAQLIDLTPENVIRILSEFSKENIIKLEGKKITLKDIKKLKKICELG